MNLVLSFGAGLILGAIIVIVFRLVQVKTARDLAKELYLENENQRHAYINTIIDNLKASFGSLSLQALSRSTEEFLKLAQSKLSTERELTAKELESKKNLIDQQLQRLTLQLENASRFMQELEKDRVEKFGELSQQLKMTNSQTQVLMQTTNKLREALASTKTRGQWGERMAEDVLRLAGFIENVNFIKQKTLANSSSRPDFTFLLPRNLKLNMDVKFPFTNYLKFLETESPIEKENYRVNFLKDVKARMKEVTTRDYINPNQDTVDYALMFIPNEHIYAFIHENDGQLFDDGLKNGVVICSPITLYAVLAVIRQAVDNFALEKTSNEILSLLGSFKKQWQEFLEKLELVGKRITEAQKEYDILTTTRRRQLEKPLQQLEVIRTQRNISIEGTEDSEINQKVN
jgi:DNA recombination protein RmuC